MKFTPDYRPYVDGLRAVAVLSVALYHAGVPWLPGGFVGVDVFFVISGFLIINQIMSSKASNRFSFSEFWSRRALRILPPYLLVILTCSLVAPFVLVMPSEYQEFSQEAGYSSMMVVNHFFLSQQGYFDVGADTKVLLHLWSLAVEEQFYIFAPLIITGLWYLGRRSFAAACAVLFSVSFIGCAYWTGLAGDKNYAFFLMPLRAWEFIAGGAVVAAVPLLSRSPRLLVEAVALAGLAAILYAATAFTDATPFPSYWASVPVLGSCAIIAAGLAKPNIVSSILSLRLMVGIGLISYSWYLWHWPLLVFGRIYNFGSHIPVVDAAMIVLSAVLAICTYFLIERPVRLMRETRKLPLGWEPTLTGLVICVFVGASGFMVFTSQAALITRTFAGNLLPSPVGSAGVCDIRAQKTVAPCISKYDGKPLGVIIGDSQLAAATRALVSIAKAKGAGLMAISAGGCISLLTVTSRTPDTAMTDRCNDGRANAQKLLPVAKPDFAILYSYWTLYADNRSAYFIAKNGKRVADQRQAFLSGFASTVDYLKSVGVSRILVIGPTPTFPKPAPNCIVRSLHYKLDPDAQCAQPRQAEDARRTVAMEWLNTATDGRPEVRLIDPSEALCDNTYCRSFLDGTVLFNDANHISDAGVKLIAKRFRPDFDWVTKAAVTSQAH